MESRRYPTDLSDDEWRCIGPQLPEPRKPLPEKVAKTWAQEEWAKEGKEVDWQRLMPPRGFKVLPRSGWSRERLHGWARRVG